MTQQQTPLFPLDDAGIRACTVDLVEVEAELAAEEVQHKEYLRARKENREALIHQRKALSAQLRESFAAKK